MKHLASLTAAVALLSETADAFWRMECFSRTGFERIDPLVNPGEPAAHGHAILGGSNFGIDTSYEDLRQSDCTSCRVVDDKSAYWTPGLMFQHENGTFELLKQVGGMLAYYKLEKDEGQTIEAFPKGFRMLAGNTTLRSFYTNRQVAEKSLWSGEDSTQAAIAQKAIGFNCLAYKKNAEATLFRHALPDKDYIDAHCDDGLRAEIAFPSCWNGDATSADHQSHVAYASVIDGGTCPEGHNRRLPSLLFETKWDTVAFREVPGRFVFSNGDITGYGYHGDFINGWGSDVLKDAIKNCDQQVPSGSISECSTFNTLTEIQSEEDTTKCKLRRIPDALAGDNCAGPTDSLCGNVAILNSDGTVEGGGGKEPSVHIAAEPMSKAKVSYSASSPDAKPTTTKQPIPDADGGRAPEPTKNKALAAPVAEPAAPMLTQAPAPVQPKGDIIATTTYTSDGVQYRVVIEQVAVTVTVEAPVLRRQAHAHHMLHKRRHRHYGMLGRR